MDFLKRTWAEIRLDALAHNFRQIRRKVGPDCKIMAVVKADGYGHGDRQVSQVFQREGADWFAVSNIEEAMHLRQAGITKPILILGFTPVDRAAQLYANRISQTVFSLDYARELSLQAQKAGAEVDCHIKLDTGMSRLGFLCDPAHFCSRWSKSARQLRCPGLPAPGFLPILPVPTRPMRILTGLRWSSLAAIKRRGRAGKRGIHFSLHHCCNSAATMRFPKCIWTWCVPG